MKTIDRWPMASTFTDCGRWTDDSGWPNYRFNRPVNIGTLFEIQDVLPVLLRTR